MRTFQVKYRMDKLPKVHSSDVDALNKVQAERIVKRNTRVSDIVSVEDITGPEELKELLRF